MKADVTSYEHASNGLSLQLMPETEAEVELLRAIWKHGHLDTGHPCGAFGVTGFYVRVFDRREKGGGT